MPTSAVNSYLFNNTTKNYQANVTNTVSDSLSGNTTPTNSKSFNTLNGINLLPVVVSLTFINNALKHIFTLIYIFFKAKHANCT
jgi:hypothetical protein